MNDDHEAGCLEDTTGECLVGVATMAPTLLAAIVWPDIMNGRLRGLCVEVRGVQREDRFDVADVLRVQLGARENDCSSGGTCRAVLGRRRGAVTIRPEIRDRFQAVVARDRAG